MSTQNTQSEWERRVDAGYFKMTVEFLQHPELRETLIMACRPVDPAQYPEATRAHSRDLERMAPSDDTWTEIDCRCCGLSVLMGPRQRTNYDLDPTAFTVLCFLCASKAVGPDPVIETMGGK